MHRAPTLNYIETDSLLMRSNNNSKANYEYTDDLRGGESFLENCRSDNKGENKGRALNRINIAQLAFV